MERIDIEAVTVNKRQICGIPDGTAAMRGARQRWRCSLEPHNGRTAEHVLLLPRAAQQCEDLRKPEDRGW